MITDKLIKNYIYYSIDEVLNRHNIDKSTIEEIKSELYNKFKEFVSLLE
jgi:hypothetical protein